jgi:hypothetical protein
VVVEECPGKTKKETKRKGILYVEDKGVFAAWQQATSIHERSFD